VLELIGDEKKLHHVAFEVADDRELDRAVEILGKQNIQIALGPERGVEPGLGRVLLRRYGPRGKHFRDLLGGLIAIPLIAV
jgi:hypothetical protein